MTYPPGSRVRPLGKVPVQVLWHPVRPGITGTQAKRYVNPQANLDALNGVEKEEPEPLIEHVEIEDLSEIRPRPEALQHLIARVTVHLTPKQLWLIDPGKVFTGFPGCSGLPSNGICASLQA